MTCKWKPGSLETLSLPLKSVVKMESPQPGGWVQPPSQTLKCLEKPVFVFSSEHKVPESA